MSNKTVSAFLLIDTNWSRIMITFRKFISGQHATHAYWPCYPVLGIKRDNSHLCCLSEDLNLGFSIYKTFSFQYILWVILDILYQKRLQPLHFTSFGFLFCIKMPPPLFTHINLRVSQKHSCIFKILQFTYISLPLTTYQSPQFSFMLYQNTILYYD